MAHPAFIVKTAKDGQFRFNLTAKNGEIIATSESYKTKASCMNGIESVKKNAPNAEVNGEKNPKFIVSTIKDGQFRFNLTATNGEIIATSESYKAQAGCINGVESVKKNAPIAEIDDQTGQVAAA